MFLRSEDMEPDRVALPGSVLDQLSKFLDIDRSSFPQSVLGYTNCNDRRGEKVSCKEKSSDYAISGNRTMLNETREFVYLHFKTECEILHRDFGVEYPECYNVVK